MTNAVIHTGAWVVYPEYLLASNIHNGNYAHISFNDKDEVAVWCINVPASWMLEQLADWAGQNLGMLKSCCYGQREYNEILV